MSYFSLTEVKDKSGRDVLTITLDYRYGALGKVKCCFCTIGLLQSLKIIKKSKVAVRDIKKINREFADILKKKKADIIFLQSCDILEYPGIFDLLKILKKYRKKVVIHTPGVVLADKKFVAELAKYDVKFEITFLSCDPLTYFKMTGSRAAMSLLVKAMANLKQYNLAFGVSVVLTRTNLAQLRNTILFLTQKYDFKQLTLRIYYPEDIEKSIPHKVKGEQMYDILYGELLSYSEINEGLCKLGELEKKPDLLLVNFPICQIDPELFDKFKMDFSYSNLDRKNQLTECKKCLDKERCSAVPKVYFKKFKIKKIDLARTNALVRKILEKPITEDILRLHIEEVQAGQEYILKGQGYGLYIKGASSLTEEDLDMVRLLFTTYLRQGGQTAKKKLKDHLKKESNAGYKKIIELNIKEVFSAGRQRK